MTGIELFTIAKTAITLGDVLMVGGALTSAAGVAQTMSAQANAAEYNAKVTRMEGAAEEARRRKASELHLGQMRANIAKGGVAMAGTPLMMMAESAEMAEIDAVNARWSAESSATLDDYRARSTRQAKPYAVGASLLTGATGMARRF